MSMSAADQAWLKHKAKPSLLSTIDNLKRAKRHRYAIGHLDEGEQIGTAVVVGSGPSLTSRGGVIRELQHSGAMVITTNTGLPALAKMSIVPNVVATREVVDVGSHLDHPAGCIAVDLAAAPSVWEAAERNGSKVIWFVGAAMQYFELASKLGVKPLYGGGAALTAAVALAAEWGARRIVLVGVDLAFADDGAGYADGSAWSGYRGELGDDMVIIGGDGYAAMVEQSKHSNIKPPPQAQRTVEATAYGGNGTVRQLLTWADQKQWLETFAERHQQLDLINATCAGVRIEGWVEGLVNYRQTLPSMRTVQEDVVDAVIDDIRRQCKTVGALGATVRDPQGCVAAVPGWLDGNALVEAVAAPDIVAQRDMRLPAKQAIIAQSEALEAAAAQVLSTLEET